MDEQRRIKLDMLDRPKRALRPVRRDAIEYIELCSSVKKDGVLQPILVRPKDDRFEIVEGWHRYEASIEAGWSDIPCMIRDMTDRDVMVFQLKCNTIRPKTFSFEYARRLKLLMEEGLTLNKLSALIDKSPKWISDQIQMNRLREDLRPAVTEGKIPLTSAVALANLPHDLQDKFVEDAVTMRTGDFLERAKQARRDFQTYLSRQKVEERKIGARTPRLRNINLVKREAVNGKLRDKVLEAMECKTPADGWEAAMAWVLMLDPLSVNNRLTNQEKQERIASREEYRKLNRKLIKKYVTSQLEKKTNE